MDPSPATTSLGNVFWTDAIGKAAAHASPHRRQWLEQPEMRGGVPELGLYRRPYATEKVGQVRPSASHHAKYGCRDSRQARSRSATSDVSGTLDLGTGFQDMCVP